MDSSRPPIHPYFQYPAPRQFIQSSPSMDPMDPYSEPSLFIPSSPSIDPYSERSQIHSSYPSNLSIEEPSKEPSDGPPEEDGDPDKSEALFSMYLDRSDEDDRKTTEKWKGESDAILIFTGLFSAALAALLAISIQGLQSNPQDTSVFYLGNIYHLLADNTSSQLTTRSAPSNPPKFSPPTSAVIVNSLWFLSLVMSLTGALLAVFIQQWALTYLEATQGRDSPHRRARIRAYHEQGLEKLDLHRVTRAVPILIHLSIFLFFAGLPVFLFNISRTVFNVVVAWLALCVTGYACITVMPIFYQNSPYYSPLSSSIWCCVTNMLFIIYRLLKNFMPRNSFVLRFLQWYDGRYARSRFLWPSLRAMQKAAGQFSQTLPSKIDYDALLQMFKTFNEDDEFEHFFDALPSLCKSIKLNNARRDFIQPNKRTLSRALIGMMDRTLLSELVPEEVKQRRIIICTKVIIVTSLLEYQWILRRVLFGEWIRFSSSIHFGHSVQGWKNISDPITEFYAQFVVAVTLASVQEHDDHWFELASRQLNESKSLLQDYFAIHGDSILLANAIFIIRRAIQISGLEDDHRGEILEASSMKLKLICRFDIHKTLPELQHQFCSLWNQIVDAAQNNTSAVTLSMTTLRTIRRLYISLHENMDCSPKAFTTRTDDGDPVLYKARSYPKCIINEHRHAVPVPELQLDGPPKDGPRVTNSSMAMIPALSSALVSLKPSTTPYSPTSAPPIQPFRTDPSLFHPGLPSSYYQLSPGPSQPGPASHLSYPGPPQLGPAPYPPQLLPSSYYQLPPGSSQPGPASHLSYPGPAPHPSYPGPAPHPSYPGPAPHPSYPGSPHLGPASHPSYPGPGQLGSSYPSPPYLGPTRPSQAGRSQAYLDPNPVPLVPRVTPSPSRHPGSIIPPAENVSTISLPPPHEMAQPVASFSPYYPHPLGQDLYPHSASSFRLGSSSPVHHSRHVLETTDSGDEYLEVDADDAPTHPEPALPQAGWQEPPTISPGAITPTSTSPSIYTDASRGSSELVATTNHLGPSVSPMTATVETPSALPLPASAFATGSEIVAPVPLPVILSTPKERVPAPEPPSQLSQGPPVNSPNTRIPMQAPPGTNLTHFNVVSSRTPAVPVYPLGQTIPVSAPSSASSMAVPLSMGERIVSVRSSVARRGSPTPMTGGGTMSVPPSTDQRGVMTEGNTMSVLPSAVRRGGPAPMTEGMPVPLYMNQRGSRAQTDMLSVITFNCNKYWEFSELLCYSPHSVLYEDKLYPTALHLFEARKFLSHLPDLADRIRQCKGVDEVTSISAEMVNFIRRDWANVMIDTMDDVMYLKFRQHDDLRTLLLDTYPSRLVYTELGDLFWGGDGGGTGMNELGKSLMRVRERLGIEGGNLIDQRPTPPQ